jgi:hypothetical protein
MCFGAQIAQHSIKLLKQSNLFSKTFPLTLLPPEPNMQPESSNGFASVGTILPEERAALLPGGSFRFTSDLARLPDS